MEARGVTKMDAVAGQHRADDDGRAVTPESQYLIGIADEIASGRLDIASLADMPGEDVQKRLCHSGSALDGR